eukprot:COSAG01_NODE_29377_length_639_cov_1.051852_1_plen_46_part_10
MPAPATTLSAPASQVSPHAMKKRGRPRKYEGLGEEERRKRRMADNR